MSKIISPATVETDPAKIAAAEKIVQISLGQTECKDGYADIEISQKMLDDAGKALANQYYFAVDRDGTIEVVSARYFEKHKGWSGEPEPVDHLMPGFELLTSCSWGAPMDQLKTPEEAALFLQNQGFCWNEAFQSNRSEDSALTASLAQTLAQQGHAVEEKTAPKKKPHGPTHP
ncbi:MAG: hypothetical protein HY052_10105 [Proteobacteria bacterium]|nr:hypothetical protein [Pseudomonadota bacterium]